MSGSVVAAVALPPPVTGQNLVSARVVKLIELSAAKLRLVDISPKAYQKSTIYHLRRLLAVLKVPIVLAANLRPQPRSFYTIVDAGYGMIYTMTLCGISRLLGYRLFLHHHAASMTKQYQRRFATLSRIAGRNATHIVLSETMSEDLRRLYSTCQKVFVAHNAGHVDDPGDTLHEQRNRKVTLGFLSNLSLDKGIDTVLEAFARVRDSGVDALLYLAGPVTDSAVKALVTESQRRFGAGLVCLGPVRGDAKVQFFKNLDIFLFPSRYKIEAQPMVVLEALSYGVPAVVTPQGYTAEICERLGTVAEPSAYLEFVVSYVDRWRSEQGFACAQSAAARSCFTRLKEGSLRDLSQLVALITSSSEDGPAPTRVA